MIFLITLFNSFFSLSLSLSLRNGKSDRILSHGPPIPPDLNSFFIFDFQIPDIQEREKRERERERGDFFFFQHYKQVEYKSKHL